MQKNNEQVKKQHYAGIVIAVLFSLVLCIGVVVFGQLNSKPAALDLNNLPAEGYAYNDTHGKVPGDPENGIRDLKRLYQVVQVYRSRTGKYPEVIFDIAEDVPNAPKEYGFRTYAETLSFFANPDTKYGDTDKDMGPSFVPYAITTKRPDKTSIGGPKRAGERDVVAYTPLYVHQNSRLFNGERSTTNPVGNYLVLWDDGAVEKVPYDRIVYIDRGRNFEGRGYGMAFPGQAGMPAKGVISYADYQRKYGIVVKR